MHILYRPTLITPPRTFLNRRDWAAERLETFVAGTLSSGEEVCSSYISSPEFFLDGSEKDARAALWRHL